MPITAADIRDVVLKEDDFGHEMRVGKVIRDIPGIQIEHGGTYIDSVTGKPRQFDFRCSIKKESAELNLAVECKNLNSSAPLVICGTKRQSNEASHDLIGWRPGSGYKQVAYTSRPIPVTFRANGVYAFYQPDKFVGKSSVRIKPNPNSKALNQFVADSDSDVYEKWAQALSSSVGLIETARERAMRHQVSEFCTTVLPAVVVPDDSIWKVEYDENGSICGQPENVNNCELFVGREILLNDQVFPHQFKFSHIHFFTIGGFGSFLSSMTSDNNVWNKLFTLKSQQIS
jgi:hypothetical protein